MTVIGGAMNLAAKPEKHTRTEVRTALVSAAMYSLAERQGFQPTRLVEHLPARAIAGVSRPIDLVALKSLPVAA